MADSRHALVFASILSLALAPFLLMQAGILPAAYAVGLYVLIGIVGLLQPELAEFKEYERGVVFRFGRFDRLVGPGLVLMFTVFERYERVDLRTQDIDMPPQEAVTQDNIKVKVDAIAFWRVKDPLKVVLEVKDPKPKLAQVLIANLRQAVGHLTLDALFVSTDDLNGKLSKALEDVAKQWGIQVTRVEIQHIELPPALESAMRKRQEALEYKAKVETEAMAKQIALETINKAVSQMSDKTMTYLYLDSLKAVAAGKSTKILFPMELSKLAHSLSSKLGVPEEKTDYAQLAKAVLAKLPADLLEKSEKDKK